MEQLLKIMLRPTCKGSRSNGAEIGLRIDDRLSSLLAPWLGSIFTQNLETYIEFSFLVRILKKIAVVNCLLFADTFKNQNCPWIGFKSIPIPLHENFNSLSVLKPHYISK